MGKDVNHIMASDAIKNPRSAAAVGVEEQADNLAKAQRESLRLASQALASGNLLGRSRHAARAEALGKMRDRVLRKARKGS